MLKVKSVRTVGFVGNDDLLVKELTCPFAKTKQGNCFYYKSALYRVESVDDACVRVVVFSAVELYCGFEKLLEMCENPKSVVYITDCKRARKMGVSIDKKRLCYMLGCPVVFDRGYLVTGINRLLAAIHIVSDTPSYYTALENPSIARRRVLSIKLGFIHKIKRICMKIFGINK